MRVPNFPNLPHHTPGYERWLDHHPNTFAALVVLAMLLNLFFIFLAIRGPREHP